MADAVLRIKLETADGKPAVAASDIRLPEGISPKLAKAVVRELVIKRIDDNLDAALKAIGIG